MSRPLLLLWLVSYYVGTLGTHTEIKRVAEEKVTLPCHHQLGLPEKDTLDIEWLLTDNEGNQKVIMNYLKTGRGFLLICMGTPRPDGKQSSHKCLLTSKIK